LGHLRSNNLTSQLDVTNHYSIIGCMIYHEQLLNNNSFDKNDNLNKQEGKFSKKI